MIVRKLAIPAILAATVLVAGIFAFMPIEQASTIHTTVIDDLQTQVITAGPFTVDAEGDDGDICIDLAANEGEMKIFSAFIDTTDMEGTAQIEITGLELDGDDCDATPSITFDTFAIVAFPIADVGVLPFEDSEILALISSQNAEIPIPVTVSDNVIISIDAVLGNDGDGYTYTITFVVETSDGATPTILEDLP